MPCNWLRRLSMAEISGREAERGWAAETRTSGKTRNPDHWDIDTQGSGQREQRCAQPEVDPEGKTTETNEKNNSFI